MGKIVQLKFNINYKISKIIFFLEVCEAGHYFDTGTKSCQGCTAGYRETDMDQFAGCQNCGAGMCPKDDFTGCREIQDTEVFLYSTCRLN